MFVLPGHDGAPGGDIQYCNSATSPHSLLRGTGLAA